MPYLARCKCGYIVEGRNLTALYDLQEAHNLNRHDEESGDWTEPIEIDELSYQNFMGDIHTKNKKARIENTKAVMKIWETNFHSLE